MSLLPGILFRYIFRQAAGAVAMILTSLTGVVWIALALKQLNLVTSQGQDTWLLIKMTLLALPNLMALIAPIALLVSAIHVLNRLNGESELIVTTAGGGTIWTIAKPLLALVSEQTLIEETVGRLQPTIPPERVLILTSRDIAPTVSSIGTSASTRC